MIRPELKYLCSPDLERDELPADPDDCAVFCEADIGPVGTDDANIFGFTAVTPQFLAREPDVRTGRGCLVVPRFTWEAVRQEIEKLLAGAARPTWEEVAAELNRTLEWEFGEELP